MKAAVQRRLSRRVHGAAALALFMAILSGSATLAAAQKVGPKAGSLIAVGGGRVGPEILDKFFELAGGKEASIVIIPTAGGADEYGGDWGGLNMFREAGATHVTLLHTKDRAEANSEAFVLPLRTASAVWFGGGRQWRLVDAYMDTLTQHEIEKVLKRGGVIAGSSAGATIQASYLVRGAVEGNRIMMVPGYEEGFAYLRNVAIDQHLITRGRVEDLIEVIDAHPELLGIGIDESTAIVVHGDRFEVLGASKVAVYHKDVFSMTGEHYFFLSSGDVYNMRRRVVEVKR